MGHQCRKSKDLLAFYDVVPDKLDFTGKYLKPTKLLGIKGIKTVFALSASPALADDSVSSWYDEKR